MQLKSKSKTFPDVLFFESFMHQDARGIFEKPFFGKELQNYFPMISEVIISKSTKDVIRGLHFQIPPHDTEKLIYCIEGQIQDVFIDLRKNSKTYGLHESVHLCDDDNKSVLIPKGFAHGFSVLSDSATVLYLQSTNFSLDHDRGIQPLSAGINWEVENPILSEKDKALSKLEEFISPW